MSATRLRQDLWLLDAKVQANAFELYRQGCAHLFDITLMSPEARFYNRLEGYNLDSVALARCVGVAQRFERNLGHILADGGDTVLIVMDLVSSDWAGDYDGRPASSQRGEVRFIDMARPFDMTVASDYRTLHMILPRAALGEASTLDFHGLVVSGADDGCRMLVAYLRALEASLDQLTTADAATAAKAIAVLAAGALEARAARTPGDPRPIEKMLLSEGRRFIEERLDDVALSPELVRQRLGVSRSLLYRAFEPVGGVSAFIQARRLDQAFDAILRDRAEQHTLGEIGYRHGFRSDAHFSRAFRARFGVAPGRLRRLGDAARRDGLSALERPDDVWAWLRSV